MNLFLLLATALTLLAAGLVLWPLLRKSPPLIDEFRARRDLNRQIYNERIAQIDHEEQGGRLSSSQARQLRDEAGKRLIDDVAQLKDQVRAPAPGKRWLAGLAVVALIPMISVGVYLQSDSWMLVGANDDQPAWQYLTRQLESRIDNAPLDTQAWLMLARTRRAQSDTAGAIQAYAQLNELTDYEVSEYLADEAEVRILEQEGVFPATARERLQQALTVDPDNSRALWYAGLGALSAGDSPLARRHWLLLAQQELPENFRNVLHKQLTQLGVPAEQIPEPPKALGNGARLRLQIQAMDELVDGLPPDTPVFVMARPADGSRNILAVRKHQLNELPLSTELADGMNMAGGPQLSDYKQYRVVVRVAVSGDALPKTGDPYGEIQVREAGSDTVHPLVLNKRWP